MKKRFRQFTAWMALVVVVAAVGIGLVLNTALAADEPGHAAGKEEVSNQPAGGSGMSRNDVFIAMSVAAVTIGASVSAAYAVAKVGSAAMGAVSENPDLMARSLIFVGLAEGIAIYGLIVAIMLLGKMG